MTETEIKKVQNQLIDDLVAEISQYVIHKAITERQKGYKEALTDTIQLLLITKKD